VYDIIVKFRLMLERWCDCQQKRDDFLVRDTSLSSTKQKSLESWLIVDFKLEVMRKEFIVA
jgi:hypothetical protein